MAGTNIDSELLELKADGRYKNLQAARSMSASKEAKALCKLKASRSSILVASLLQEKQRIAGRLQIKSNSGG
jgi:hypothetical protein